MRIGIFSKTVIPAQAGIQVVNLAEGHS